jgi:uncharacterized protein
MAFDKGVPLAVARGGAVLDTPIQVPRPSVPEGQQTPALERPPQGTGPWRASSYVVYVDLPEEPEHVLLTHTYTGAYDRVSRRVAAYVRSLEPAHAPAPL